MIPFEAITSAAVTVASPTLTTPSVTVNVTSSPLYIVAVIPSVTSVDATEPTYTWYVRMSVSVALPSSLSSAAKSIPASVKAWSVGANTVNGPSPSSVATNSACVSAATNESCDPVFAAFVGMSSVSSATAIGEKISIAVISIVIGAIRITVSFVRSIKRSV